MPEPEFVEHLKEDLAGKRSLLCTCELTRLEGQLRGLPEDAGLVSIIKELRKTIADSEQLLGRMSRYKLASDDGPEDLSEGVSDV